MYWLNVVRVCVRECSLTINLLCPGLFCRRSWSLFPLLRRLSHFHFYLSVLFVASLRLGMNNLEHARKFDLSPFVLHRRLPQYLSFIYRSCLYLPYVLGKATLNTLASSTFLLLYYTGDYHNTSLYLSVVFVVSFSHVVRNL